MSIYFRDQVFLSGLENLNRAKNRKDQKIQAKDLEKYALSTKNIFLIYRLGIEFDALNLSIRNIQNFIIKSNYPSFIFKFAREMKKANIKKLQEAIIKCGEPLDIAKFGCFIERSDKKLIENIISKSTSAKSAYLLLTLVRDCDVEKIKPIIMKSKRPRYLYALARKIKNEEELSTIEDLIIKAGKALYIRLFAINIENANISRLENKIIELNNRKEMKRFANSVEKSVRLKKLLLLF
jgi:hypothetical protein